MSNIVKITDFQSVFSNGNRDEIDPRFMTALKNLRPLNGKLVKTFGFGEKIGTAASNVVDNMYTYIHDELTGGELYIIVYIDNTASNEVYLYGWNGSSWVGLDSISGISHSETFYHDESRNPIVYEGGRLRFLPGALGETGSPLVECEGIWLGYIDRDYFDGNYSPTAGFYSEAATVDAPSLDITVQLITAGTEMERTLTSDYTLNYRLSYLYDYNQESLMCDPFVARFNGSDDNSVVKLLTSITKADHNKRVTGINLYRQNPTDETYKLIDTVDLTRDASDIYSDTDGAVVGDQYLYLSNLTHTINPAYDYQISTVDHLYNVTPVSVGGEYIFQFDSHDGGSRTEFEHHFNEGWAIWEDTGGGFGATPNQEERLSEDGSGLGLFCGDDIAIVKDDLGTFPHAKGILYFNDGSADQIRYIYTSYQRAVYYLGSTISVSSYDGSYQSWKVLPVTEGVFLAEDVGSGVTLSMYDTGQSENNQHPLQYAGNDTDPGRWETSIKINGKFARVINGRLIQANLVLDPGGENETQNDWLSYSEYQQYDVNPVSNVISFSYKSGGEITGLAELFGNPVVMKQQSIVYLDTKSNPDKPHLWKVIESAHNIGNLADEGYIEASGSLYVCYEDGIYRLSPNNLAPTDATPAERLRVSEPIGDVYANLTTAQKAAIKAGYNPLTSEVMFTLDEEVWAFNISSGQWREIDTGVTPGLFGEDENGQAMIFQNSDKKIYSPADDESVTCELATKTFVLDNERDRTVRRVAVNYKSAAALTCKIYYDDEVPSGDIQNGVEYAVNETPYVDGATFEVTYNGTAYNHGDTFDGTIGKHDYTTSGTGVVEHYSNHTLPANNALTSYRFRVGRWAKRLRIEITGTTGTTDVEITGIELVYD